MFKGLFISLILVAGIPQNGDVQGMYLKNVNVSQGSFRDRIIIEWQKPYDGELEYTVMRSVKKTDGFMAVTRTADLEYEDKNIERGVRYWYRVVPSQIKESSEAIPAIDNNIYYITEKEYNAFPDADFEEEGGKSAKGNKDAGGLIKNSETEKSKAAKDVKTGRNGSSSEKDEKDINRENELVKSKISYSGYTSIEDYKGINIDALMKQKKAKLKIPSNSGEKARQKESLGYLEKYYMNPVKLVLFMRMTRSYFESGELIAVNDVSRFEINKDIYRTFFYGKNYIASFDSKKLVRISAGVNDPEVGKNIVMNSNIFCIRAGKTFIVDENGITRLVHRLDGVGLTTGYLKNDSEWKSRTILLTTGRADLKKKMKDLSRPEPE